MKSNPSLDSEEEHSAWVYLETVAGRFTDSAKLEIHINKRKRKGKKRKNKSVGLQNAAIFHFYIFPGSRQNFCGPLA